VLRCMSSRRVMTATLGRRHATRAAAVTREQEPGAAGHQTPGPAKAACTAALGQAGPHVRFVVFVDVVCQTMSSRAHGRARKEQAQACACTLCPPPALTPGHAQGDQLLGPSRSRLIVSPQSSDLPEEVAPQHAWEAHHRLRIPRDRLEESNTLPPLQARRRENELLFRIRICRAVGIQQ